MEIGSVAAILGVVVSAVFSSLALWISVRTSRDTRKYKDPVFVLECDPIILDKSLDASEPQAYVVLKLINKGESFATDVEAYAEFDPYGLHVRPSKWAFVERSGGSVTWPMDERIGVLRPSILSRVDKENGHNYCRVSFKSQAGHLRVQRVPLPDVDVFITYKDDQ